MRINPPFNHSRPPLINKGHPVVACSSVLQLDFQHLSFIFLCLPSSTGESSAQRKVLRKAKTNQTSRDNVRRPRSGLACLTRRYGAADKTLSCRSRWPASAALLSGWCPAAWRCYLTMHKPFRGFPFMCLHSGFKTKLPRRAEAGQYRNISTVIHPNSSSCGVETT